MVPLLRTHTALLCALQEMLTARYGDNMDNQPMPVPMPNMHNLFWRKNQVIVTFHSEIPLVTTEGINNTQDILKRLALDTQLQKLNQFLQTRSIHYTLSFFNEKDNPQ